MQGPDGYSALHRVGEGPEPIQDVLVRYNTVIFPQGLIESIFSSFFARWYFDSTIFVVAFSCIRTSSKQGPLVAAVARPRGRWALFDCWSSSAIRSLDWAIIDDSYSGDWKKEHLEYSCTVIITYSSKLFERSSFSNGDLTKKKVCVCVYSDFHWSIGSQSREVDLVY